MKMIRFNLWLLVTTFTHQQTCESIVLAYNTQHTSSETLHVESIWRGSHVSIRRLFVSLCSSNGGRFMISTSSLASYPAKLYLLNAITTITYFDFYLVFLKISNIVILTKVVFLLYSFNPLKCR